MAQTQSPRPTWSPTHEVFNQTPHLSDYNLFQKDAVLKEALVREGADWAVGQLDELGAILGSSELQQAAVAANTVTPVLKSFDRFGNRIDEVEFHPAYHQVMSLSVEHGLHCQPWESQKAGTHTARAAKMMLAAQNEAGHCCPISMTYSVVPVIAQVPELAKAWLPLINSRSYDRRLVPATEKSGVIFGMGMTEKQGGSDVRANTSKAVKCDDGSYRLTGHKWFCSAPMSDAFLVLAQTDGGLSCFLLPRFTPCGERNRFFIQRLKEKLGNKSNASSEIEFTDAYAELVGEPGRGARTIIDMVNHTRLDCTIMSAALMRQALVQAVHHANFRSAFGKTLIQQPLMQNVLADLSIESEAATVLMMRLAGAYDRSTTSSGEGHFRRIATAIAKYWLCKRTPVLVGEALECLGGAGYVEEGPMPRLYREAPLSSIWEGSGNVICLDVLRAMAKDPDSIPALVEEFGKATGKDRRYDRFIETLKADLTNLDDMELRARALVEKMAVALQASLLLRHSPQDIADAFLASRLDGNWGRAFGTLPPDAVKLSVISRQWSE